MSIFEYKKYVEDSVVHECKRSHACVLVEVVLGKIYAPMIAVPAPSPA